MCPLCRLPQNFPHCDLPSLILNHMGHFCWLLLLVPAAFAEEISFEPNRGQTSDSVSFFTRDPDGPIFFTADGAVLLSAVEKTGFEFARANPNAKWEASEPV